MLHVGYWYITMHLIFFCQSPYLHKMVYVMNSWKHYCGPRQANLALIAYASSEGSGEPAHPRSLARTFAARSYKQWIKRNIQTESQIPGPAEWLSMRSWNVSWQNARRHKFAWRGSLLKPLSGNMLDWFNVLFGKNNWFNTCYGKKILSN